jgi:hypothetical protein
MIHPIESHLLRDYEALTPALSVAEARRRLAGGRYGVVEDEAGAPLACLREANLAGWPDDRPLASLRDRWPPLRVLPEADALSVSSVASFFRDEFFLHEDLAGVVLVDGAGRSRAVLRRRVLLDALADRAADAARSFTYRGAKGADEMMELAGEAPADSERDLMVTRYGRLDFPATAPVGQRCALVVTINREALPGMAGQVELGLTVDAWPLHVSACLVGVQPEDFLVEGPASGVIEVPRMADSAPLTFTLVPQSAGQKKIRVRFEQGNAYLGTAFIHAEVVEAASAASGAAEVEHAPVLAAGGLPPDVTIYIERAAALTYTVCVRTADDAPGSLPREIDRIEFPQAPDAYLQAIFDDLDARTRAGLAPEEFDAEVKKIGNNLYDELFHEDGFKTFYWEYMARLSAQATVQIVSDEPSIPWELLRPFRQKSDGTWESDPRYFCQRFVFSRWLSGPSFAAKLPLRRVALVAPPSNLAYVQEEVKAIRATGLQVQVIEEKAALERFLQAGQAEVVHFACHGRFKSAIPGHSVVVIGNRSLRPDDLTAENRNFGRIQPLVFLNACDSGRLGLGLTGLDGWAEAFLKANAGFFIGSVWSTTDELASRFAETFYRRLQAGDSVGEAMRQAREAARRPGDATYLSYTLYANPCVRAARPLE